MSQDTIKEFFEKDHERLDALFGEFQKNKRANFSAAKGAFKDFMAGLKRHIVWEEELLFPAFENATGVRDMGPTVVMRMEHQEIQRCLEEIHQKIRIQDPESDAAEVRLISTLEQHNLKEEQILYPAIDRIVAPELRERILREVERAISNPVNDGCGCG